MSFYGRYNGFRGFGDAIFDAMVAAMNVVTSAEAKVATATARADAAKARLARITKVSDPNWWKRLAPFGAKQTNPPDDAFEDFYKYIDAFEQDENIKKYGVGVRDDLTGIVSDVTGIPVSYTAGNYWDFDSTNELIDNELIAATDEKSAADAELKAAEKVLSAAKAVLVKAQDAQVASGKKQNAVLKAEQTAAATAAAIVADAPAKAKREAAAQAHLEYERLEKKAAGVSPLFLLGGAAAVLGLLAIVSRKKSAVAGYRRRRR